VGGHDSHDVGRVEVHVIVASSTRGPGEDGSGVVLAERLQAAGHAVGSREVVDDDAPRIRELVKRLAGRGVAAVVITGGTGLSPRDVTPEAVEPLFSRRIEGFGELFRSLSFAEIGADALMSRATAGVVGRTAVFAVPGSPAACRLAVDRLIAPALSHLVGQLGKPEAPPRLPGEITEEVELEPVPPAAGGADQPPVARAIGRAGVQVKPKDEEATAPQGDEGPWQRRIRELGGKIVRGEREPFPEEIERFAPLVDLLVTAGDIAVLELSHGRRYSLWGFPDLRRAGAKVLALGPGSPLCELVPLHRTDTGIAIDGPAGLVAARSTPVAGLAELTVGRVPPNPDGVVYAVAGDAVFVERDGKVFRWDGHKETPLGTPKQALASLALEWSRR
jgi:molybdenum cofactor biosynthesis protein B